MLASRNRALALVFEAERLTAAVVNGHLEPLTAPLAVDPLNDEPRVVAAELHDRLHTLGRLPRRAVICLPLDRVMLSTVTVPELPEADLPNYLRLQAEKEFLLSPDQMALGWSLAGGRALLAALPTAAYENLYAALRQLGIKHPRIAVSTAFAAPDEAAALVLGARHVDLVVRGAGGIVVLRRLAGAAPATQRPGPDLSAVPRELRLTAGQLAEVPPRLALVGTDENVAALQRLLNDAALPGWRIEAQPTAARPAADIAMTAAKAAATDATLPLALAPPPKPRRQALWRRVHRRHVIAAALLVILVLGSLGWAGWQQHRELHELRAEWTTMAPRAEAIEGIIAEARARRDWYGDNAPSLDLLLAITKAFPERGTVWAVRVEIKDRETVTLSGRAANRNAWLAMLDNLSENPAIQALNVAQIREDGAANEPLSFALSCRWRPQIREENR